MNNDLFENSKLNMRYVKILSLIFYTTITINDFKKTCEECGLTIDDGLDVVNKRYSIKK